MPANSASIEVLLGFCSSKGWRSWHETSSDSIVCAVMQRSLARKMDGGVRVLGMIPSSLTFALSTAHVVF
jgi:hypothetical protein